MNCEADSATERHSRDQYHGCKETYFQNRGKNWAPVLDLCMSKLSVGSPCYDTCWEEEREINECQPSVQMSILCCIQGTSLPLCLTALMHVWTQRCPRCSPWTPLLCVSCTQPLTNQMSNQTAPKIKTRVWVFCFGDLLPSTRKAFTGSYMQSHHPPQGSLF